MNNFIEIIECAWKCIFNELKKIIFANNIAQDAEYDIIG